MPLESLGFDIYPRDALGRLGKFERCPRDALGKIGMPLERWEGFPFVEG